MAKQSIFQVYFNRLYQLLNKYVNSNGNPFFDEITRRAFINNAFDGALTLLGILMGNLVLGEIYPPTIISTGLGACLAMGMSGAFGRFFSERAERKHALLQIEKYMFTDLSDSMLAQESKKKVITISLVDGLSPTIAAVIPLIPFFFAQSMLITVSLSVILSFILDFLVLFILGAFLGKLSDENILLHGILMVGVGFITGIIILLSSMLFA
jgi:predicted membrane protein (TIGR00267 family)